MKGASIGLVVMMVIGLVMTVASVALATGFTQAIWAGVGLFIFVIGGVGILFSNLYVKARGNTAFVKTGQGGIKVIKDGGRIIIGFLHDIIPVSLETMKIVVDKTGKDALITTDIRAEVIAEFYIRVKNDELSIQAAARTLGDKISSGQKGQRKLDDVEGLLRAQQSAVASLEMEKLVDALRTVSATKTLIELNTNRSEFKKTVMEIVKEGLEQNGLELEDVTISRLDQPKLEDFSETNVFDAQGRMHIQKTVSAASVKENEFVKNAELDIKKRDVDTRMAILEQEQNEKFKEADQQREVRAYKAEQDKKAGVAEIENSQAVDTREIEKQREVELAAVEQAKQVQLKNIEREQAQRTADVEKQKAVEVAERDQHIAIAKKDEEKALALEQQNLAQAKAEGAEQEIKTVEVVATAERQKRKAIVDQEAESERNLIEAQKQADAEAYRVERKAQADKEAAEASYIAKVRAAEADKESMEKKADGLRAEQMVPVEVSREQVNVREAEVAVERKSLEQQQEFGKVAIEKDIAITTINANKEIRIESAKAMAVAFTNTKMELWGDTATMETMMSRFTNGQGNGQYLEGLLDQLPEELRGLVNTTLGAAKSLAAKTSGAEATT